MSQKIVHARVRASRPVPIPNPTTTTLNVVVGPSSWAETFTTSASGRDRASLRRSMTAREDQWI